KHHGIPFYVAIPLSTIDWELNSGRAIPIEERAEDEVLGAWGVMESQRSKVQSPKSNGGRRVYVRVANAASGALNPGFDVTPAEFITGIITPEGVFPPQELWKHRHRLGAVGKV